MRPMFARGVAATAVFTALFTALCSCSSAARSTHVTAQQVQHLSPGRTVRVVGHVTSWSDARTCLRDAAATHCAPVGCTTFESEAAAQAVTEQLGDDGPRSARPLGQIATGVLTVAACQGKNRLQWRLVDASH